MILYIDSTQYNKIAFTLSGKKLVKKSFKINPQESHKTLALLEQFLKSAKVKGEDLKQIVVNKGPGSYTGVRVGVTHALALGFAWKVPVKALSKEQFDKFLIN